MRVLVMLTTNVTKAVLARRSANVLAEHFRKIALTLKSCFQSHRHQRQVGVLQQFDGTVHTELVEQVGERAVSLSSK